MDWEVVASIAIPVVAIATLLGLAFNRDRRTHDAFRAFAQKHGLRFTEAQVTAGVLARGEGKLDGKALYAGYVWVDGFVEGIGPKADGRSMAVVAMTVDSTAGINRDVPVVRQFLNSNGSLTETAITYAFPKRRFTPIVKEEIDAALALVRQVAAAGR